MPVNVLTNSTLSSAVSSRVASSGFLAKIIISNIDKMKESTTNYSRFNYPLASNNGYILYLQNNNHMENSMESMNIIYDAESLLEHLEQYVQKERDDLDFELGEYRKTKEKLEEKIEAKEEELNEEEDETTQIKLNDELQDMKSDYNSMIEEDETKCELIGKHDSIIDDVYTVKTGFSKALHDAITTGRYTENGEYYIFIRSTNMNTALTNIFEEEWVYESDIFEEFEVVDIEMDDEEDLEEVGEEHTGNEENQPTNQDIDEDGFQRLPSTIDEDVNNTDDDPSSDDESDDPSTEEEIKEDNEKKEFITKNKYELRDENTSLKKSLKQKDDEIASLKALLKIYLK